MSAYSVGKMKWFGEKPSYSHHLALLVFCCWTILLVLADSRDVPNSDFPACNQVQFRCANAICIPRTFLCDGYQDCSDGSDEVNCTAVTCPDNTFFCPKGGADGGPKCIPKSKLCDGESDCEDGADEETACSNSSCPSLDCEYKCQASSTGGSCHCPNGQKVAADNRTCIDRDCIDWGSCDQICTNTDSGYNCSCGQGYDLKDKNKCSALNGSSLILYFVHDKAIFRMGPTGVDVQIVANTTGASGLDFHYSKNMLLWSDIKTKRIHSQQLKMDSDELSSIKDIDIALPGMWLPVAIAVDWVGNKLYVADSFGQKIDVFEFPPNHSHAIVLGSNLTDPADIALDPTVGYMFVAESSNVLRANMDGSNAHAIVSGADYKPSGIAVDIFSKRVFWCDSLLNHIETVDYDGQGRFLIIRGQSIQTPARLAIFESKVYWTDSINQGVMSVDKYDSSNIHPIYRMRNIRDPQAVKAVHSLTQPYAGNPCGDNNGACQHMCIITNTGRSLGFRCVCNIGYRLASDQRTCDVVTEFMVYAQGKCIKGKVLNPVVEGFDDAILPVPSRRARFVGLDFDARDRHIYYSDVLQNVIFRVHPNGTSPEVIVASHIEGVEGVAVDWASKNLYYIDSRNGTLNVLSTRNVTYRRTLLRNLKRARAIVVYPNKGYIFFSEWQDPANISRVSSDGNNLTVFKNLTLRWPNGLSIDFKRDRLYWCDGSLNHVQHSNLDGTDVKTVNSRLIRRPYSIVIHNDFMYISVWSSNAIIKLHKLTGDLEETLITEPGTNRIFGVKIYSELEQTINDTHPCWSNNGGCSKFCFAIPDDSASLSAKCGCPYGERLMPDQRTCQSDPSHEPPVQACPNIWDFTCSNQRCIPRRWTCDGDDDCLDNSDEEHNCTSPNFK